MGFIVKCHTALKPGFSVNTSYGRTNMNPYFTLPIAAKFSPILGGAYPTITVVFR